MTMSKACCTLLVHENRGFVVYFDTKEKHSPLLYGGRSAINADALVRLEFDCLILQLGFCS